METRTRFRIRTVATWTLSVVMTGLMGLAGAAKFLAPDVWGQMFADWGYPGWMRAFIGTAEIGGAIGLVIPRVARYAAAGLGIIMVGAAINNIVNESRLGVAQPVIYAAVLTTIFLLRSRGRIRRD